MQVENRKLDLTRQHIIPFGTIIQIHTPKQINHSYPRGELGIILGPSDCTYNAMDAYAKYSQKIIVRHQYTVYKYIPKKFPFKLHNQPTTPAALIKKVHVLEKQERQTKTPQKDVSEPENLTAAEAEELLDSIGSEGTHPLPIQSTYVAPTTAITMCVPLQTTNQAPTIPETTTSTTFETGNPVTTTTDPPITTTVIEKGVEDKL
jgi:hypothetical protein